MLDHTNAPRLADTDDARARDPAGRPGRTSAARSSRWCWPRRPRRPARRPRWCGSTYDEEPHEAELPRGRRDLPARARSTRPWTTDTDEGDVDAALADAAVVVDADLPDRPTSTTTRWSRTRRSPGGRGGRSARRSTMFDSTQGVHGVAQTLAPLLGLEPDAGAGAGAVRRRWLRQQGTAARPRDGGRAGRAARPTAGRSSWP